MLQKTMRLAFSFSFFFVNSFYFLLPIANGQCGSYNDCSICVDSNCAWAEGWCMATCQMIADAKCYGFEKFPESTATQICEQKDIDQANSRTCSSQKDCSSCTQTVQLGGAFCEWYDNGEFCSTGGCNLAGCGSSVCCTSANDCTSCLENNCAWVPESAFGSCESSCDVIADTSCYSEEYSPEGETAADICGRVDTNQQNEDICSAAIDCDSCTNLVQADGVTTCKWYMDFCGTGGCDMNGICGTATCMEETGSGDSGGIEPPPCFAGNNQVLVREVGMTPLKKLRIGEYVQVENGGYSQIYSLGHVDPSRKSPFMQIHSNKLKSPLEITQDHLLFIKSKGKIKSTAASLVQIGDELLLPSGYTSVVTNVRSVNRKGVYAPLTMKGTIVVSGVVASCYPTLQPNAETLQFLSGRVKTPFSMHLLSHVALSPRRWLCYFQWDSCQNEAYTSEGLATWAHTLWVVAKLFLENDLEMTTEIFVVLAAAFVMMATSSKGKMVAMRSLTFCVLYSSIITWILLLFGLRALFYYWA